MRKTTLFQPQLIVAFMALLLAAIACSSVDDLIGHQQQSGPTPTLPVFATATPGGQLSVWLITPTGQVDIPTATITPGGPTLTPLPTNGEIIQSVGTATAAYATFSAATQTAASTPAGPLYRTSDCPTPGAPIPPTKPTSFDQYPEVIGVYLSGGGPTTILESTLRGWGAITDAGGTIQADTDLTGDGANEIIITLFDPSNYQPGKESPGQILVYGCVDKGYRLLYSTPYTTGTMLPTLKRVGDMNGDVRPDLVFTQQVCVANQCVESMQILSWNSTIGAFKPLNNTPINTTNGKVAIGDIDGDGVLEVSITFNPPSDTTTGPTRRITEIWDWDSTNYRLALVEADPPIYRIHAVQDADVMFAASDWKDAIKVYDRVRDDPNLQPWVAPNEGPMLRAYATFKKLLAQFASRRKMDDTLATLLSENPPGSPGEGYGLIAQAFLDNYSKTRNKKKACDAALAIAATRPETLAALNDYGSANRIYSFTDFCPFTEK